MLASTRRRGDGEPQLLQADIDGPPHPDSWNLQIKATKVRNIEIDNITPEDIESGPPRANWLPMRVYQEYNVREITDGETTADLKWASPSEKDAESVPSTESSESVTKRLRKK